MIRRVGLIAIEEPVRVSVDIYRTIFRRQKQKLQPAETDHAIQRNVNAKRHLVWLIIWSAQRREEQAQEGERAKCEKEGTEGK